MIEMYVLAAIALVVAGAGIGILMMVCPRIDRDDRPGSGPADINDVRACVARQVTGADARRPELAGEARRRAGIVPVK